jgi:hypothetical protein
MVAPGGCGWRRDRPAVTDPLPGSTVTGLLVLVAAAAGPSPGWPSSTVADDYFAVVAATLKVAFSKSLSRDDGPTSTP